MRWIAILILGALLAGCASVHTRKAESRWLSQTGGYSVELEVSESELNKTLVIRDTRRKRVVQTYSVERFASVIFSPSENKHVIVDDFASNENRLFIFDRQGNVGQMVGRELGELDPRIRLTMLKYSHVYFRNVKWRGDDAITCIVDLYDPLLPIVEKSSTIRLTIPVSRQAGMGRSVQAISPPLAPE